MGEGANTAGAIGRLLIGAGNGMTAGMVHIGEAEPKSVSTIGILQSEMRQVAHRGAAIRRPAAVAIDLHHMARGLARECLWRQTEAERIRPDGLPLLLQMLNLLRYRLDHLLDLLKLRKLVLLQQLHLLQLLRHELQQLHALRLELRAGVSVLPDRLAIERLQIRLLTDRLHAERACSVRCSEKRTHLTSLWFRMRLHSFSRQDSTNPRNLISRARERIRAECGASPRARSDVAAVSVLVRDDEARD